MTPNSKSRIELARSNARRDFWFEIVPKIDFQSSQVSPTQASIMIFARIVTGKPIIINYFYHSTNIQTAKKNRL